MHLGLEKQPPLNWIIKLWKVFYYFRLFIGYLKEEYLVVEFINNDDD